MGIKGDYCRVEKNTQDFQKLKSKFVDGLDYRNWIEELGR